MTHEDALQDLLLRFGDDGIIQWNDAQRWPKGSLEIFQKAGFLKSAPPAKSVECPGCEDNCFMPVHIQRSEQTNKTRAYIACDRRDDIGRVTIPLEQLQQWKITNRQVTKWVTGALGLKGKLPKGKATGNLVLGSLQGKKRSGFLELDATDPISFKVSGHSIPLIEVVHFEGDHLRIDRDRIMSAVDLPPAERYQSSVAKREERKLATQAMYGKWQKEYRKLKRKRPNMSDIWCSQQIARMKIANGSSAETIRKHIKKSG